jgi:hypothetical protein
MGSHSCLGGRDSLVLKPSIRHGRMPVKMAEGAALFRPTFAVPKFDSRGAGFGQVSGLHG